MNGPMKISDLIAHLEEVRRQYGEVVVVPVGPLTPGQCRDLGLMAGASVPGRLVVQMPEQPGKGYAPGGLEAYRRAQKGAESEESEEEAGGG